MVTKDDDEVFDKNFNNLLKELKEMAQKNFHDDSDKDYAELNDEEIRNFVLNERDRFKEFLKVEKTQSIRELTEAELIKKALALSLQNEMLKKMIRELKSRIEAKEVKEQRAQEETEAVKEQKAQDQKLETIEEEDEEEAADEELTSESDEDQSPRP